MNNLSIPFIDTSKILYTQTEKIFSYTATQDCVVAGTIEPSGTNASSIYVNNVRVGGTYSAVKDVTSSVFIPLKTGQTFKAECGNFNSAYPLRIFALL